MFTSILINWQHHIVYVIEVFEVNKVSIWPYFNSVATDCTLILLLVVFSRLWRNMDWCKGASFDGLLSRTGSWERADCLCHHHYKSALQSKWALLPDLEEELQIYSQ